MSGTDQFFEKKQAWSKIKDDVLRTYLEPYLAKVSQLRCPIRIADCFAGKGRFGDGEPGSPLIIYEAIQKQLAHPDNRAEIKAVFIEKEHLVALQENVPAADWVVFLEGEYEQRMANFISQYNAQRKSLFLYVDPFGIKSLRFSHFQQIREKQFISVELLLNLNAFGFLREGCRLLGLEMQHEEEEPLEYAPDVNSPERLDEIAGGSYWQDIVREFYARKISMRTAEEQFVKKYCEQLGSIFDHVIETPIKAKLSHIPKYHIIFGTNHADGLLLMADTMSKRWETFREESRGHESYLFQMDFPDASKQGACWNLDREVLAELDGDVELKELLVRLVQRLGISFSTRQYKDCLKRLEGSQISVRRVPELTPTGKVISGWEHKGKDYKIYISRKLQCQQSLL